MRPAFVLVAPEEAGVVAVQAPVGAVRRAGRQVAVAGREGRSRREAVAEVRVHAYRTSPGGELVAAFIPAGVEFGVGARAFHPHVEAGEVVVDVGRVDAHEGGPVPDPAHLVAQGVPLRRPQRVDRAPSHCCQSPGCPRQVGIISRNHGADGMHRLPKLGSGIQIIFCLPQKFGTCSGIMGIHRRCKNIVLLHRGIQHNMIALPAHGRILVINGKQAGSPHGYGFPLRQSVNRVCCHQHHAVQVVIRSQPRVAFHVGKRESRPISNGDGIRRQHSGAERIRRT